MITLAFLLAMQLELQAVPPPPPTPPPPPITGQWSIVAIGQEAVSGSQYVLRIDAAALAGRAGCNSFSAAYTLAGDLLTVEAPRSTRMACAPAIMAREQRALAILTGAVRSRRPDAGTLVLTGEEGAIRLRRAN